MASKYFSIGNIKITAPGVRVFTLPAVECCPGSTPCCRATCYALYPQTRPNVRRWRSRNYQLSLLDDFADRIVADLAQMVGHTRKMYAEGRPARTVMDYDPARFVRIHESGDFYSQTYLDKWFEVCRRLPSIVFWCYTRSYMFDFSRKPRNMKIRYSLDPSTVHPAPAGMPTCIINYPPTPGFVQCPGTKSKSIKCVKDCDLCMSTDTNILFPPHGGLAKYFAQFTGKPIPVKPREKEYDFPVARLLKGMKHPVTEIPRAYRP